MPNLSTYLSSTFLPRDLPKVLIFHDGAIIGPFCRHCGWREMDHGPNKQCLAKVNNFINVPDCGCHAVDLGPLPDGRRWVLNHSGRHIKEAKVK